MALRDAGLNDLAEMITLPFAWPDADALAAAAATAGLREVRVESPVLPMVFEGGVAQAIAALAGSPLGPALAELPGATQARLAATALQSFASLPEAGAVRGQMCSNILTARR